LVFEVPHIRKTGASDGKTYSVLTSEKYRIDTVSMSEVVKYDASAYGPPMVPHMVTICGTICAMLPHMLEHFSGKWFHHMRHHMRDVASDIKPSNKPSFK
jgi:hypothetical protein